ncbi:SRPBCC family protein [Klenkia sp. PcliD-1-E]|uniref:SRPBCC family protein n=1 Tax=Klenkia sp. PcliD-1-E TaxID=2954492 RepID=UPI0020976149|nr:SRPBCC family protein [Klenkia sp. PcliD-1-E]MCO7220874.1 SRPBCC family protein [Klenkia sp. PcliD-1-E]
MTTPTTVARDVTVPVGQHRAFEVFTRRLGDFKPPEHNLLSVPIASTTLDPRVGGTITDTGVDGSTCSWARILVWEPPQRLVFSWDIGPTWQVETDPARTSEVEVRFDAIDDHRTRVTIDHRHLDRHGPGWEGVAGGIAADEGWPLYLDRFAQLLTRES